MSEPVKSSFLNKHFQSILIIAVGLFIWLKPDKDIQVNVPAETRDTAIIITQGQAATQGGQIVSTIPYPVDRTSIQYIPDTNANRLRIQFQNLVNDHIALLQSHKSTNIQKDSVVIDSLGSIVYRQDSIRENKSIGANWSWNLKSREITVTKTLPPKRQFYLNGILQGTTAGVFTGFGTGLTYKDRKDKMFSGNALYSPQNGLTVQVGAHWKIKLGK